MLNPEQTEPPGDKPQTVQASVQIGQTEHFVQSALDALSAHIAILNEHGEIIGVNSAWQRFAIENELKNPHFAIGTNYLEVCESAEGSNSREAPLVAGAIRDMIARKIEEFYLEYPCHSKFSKRWFVVHITRFNWSGKMRVIVAHQNVTELKRAQVELDENRKRLEAILNNVGNGIVTINARGKLESLNPAATAIFGISERGLIGQDVSVLFAEPYQRMPYRQLLNTLSIYRDKELTGIRADGSEFPMLFTINEIYVSNRRMYTGIVQDITERKRMENEILEKERLSMALEKERELREFKNRFIGLMSHEFRTPLSSIMLSSDLLKLYGDKAPPEEKLMYLNNITTQVDHLTSLVRDMMAMSRAEFGHFEYAPAHADVALLVRRIVEEFRLTNRETHRITFDANVERLNSEVDIKLMRQVITNLLSNAIKYSPHGSEVAIKVKLCETLITISVSDQGIGIPEADQTMLFEPFHRARNVDNIPGTGLGLSVVKQAVELHRGEIHVKSNADTGTTFTVTLPYLPYVEAHHAEGTDQTHEDPHARKQYRSEVKKSGHDEAAPVSGDNTAARGAALGTGDD